MGKEKHCLSVMRKCCRFAAAVAKVIYRDDHYFIEIECFVALVDGRCPYDQTAFYAYGRCGRHSSGCNDVCRLPVCTLKP